MADIADSAEPPQPPAEADENLLLELEPTYDTRPQAAEDDKPRPPQRPRPQMPPRPTGAAPTASSSSEGAAYSTHAMRKLYGSPPPAAYVDPTRAAVDVALEAPPPPSAAPAASTPSSSIAETLLAGTGLEVYYADPSARAALAERAAEKADRVRASAAEKAAVAAERARAVVSAAAVSLWQSDNASAPAPAAESQLDQMQAAAMKKYKAGDYSAAHALFQQALDSCGDDDDPQVAVVCNNLAATLEKRGMPREAEALYLRGLAICEALAGGSSADQAH